LIQVQCSDLEEVDPQKCYVLSGWQRLIIDYADEIKPYLSSVIPNLFKLASKVLNKLKEVEDKVKLGDDDVDNDEE